MSAAVTSAKVSAVDRILFTLFMSVALNAIVILGIGFDFTDLFEEESPLPTLEVILVEKNDSEAPEDAEFLAQVDQSGMGNTQDQKTPRTMEAAQELPVPFDGDSDILRPEQTTERVPTAQEDVLTQYVMRA